MQIGVFGGSFDPVHNGHLTVVRAAAATLGLDRVLLVPARDQPFKVGMHRASPKDRAGMLRVAVRDDRLLAVDEREIDRPGPSYTVDTLTALRAEFPADELFLLIGADAARDIPDWHRAEAIPALATIVILTRPGVDVPVHAACGQVVTVPAVDVSASAVRARIGRGESVADSIPPAVAQYIADRRLYVEGD